MASAQLVRRLGFAHGRIFSNFPPYRIACIIGPLALLITILGLWIPRLPDGRSGGGPAPTVSAADLQICGANVDVSEIIAACQRLIKSGSLSPHDVGEAYYHIGVAEYGQSQYGVAISDLTTSLSYFPNDEEALLTRSAAEGAQGNMSAVISDSLAVLEIDPKNTGALMNLGRAYKQQGEYDKAVQAETTALGITPGLENAYQIRGSAYYSEHEYENAIQDYAAALRIDPSYNNYEAKGLSEYELHDYADATSDEQTALRLNPNDAEAQNILQLIKGQPTQ